MPAASESLTYTNPVYDGYFADPFAWRHKGEYYAVGTGPAEAQGEVLDAEEAASAMLGRFRIFPLLHSDDFVNWRYVSGALVPPDPELGNTFWAPEVAFHDGTFYLYYSVGIEDKGHQLRVATANHPLGPYADAGKSLVNPRVFPFTIDAHAFLDDDGQWYMFYARDFLNIEGDARAGTALVVDRMTDMTTLAGEPRTVGRARYEWQRFLKDRTMYGKVWDWHTLEGPAVVKRDGRYYCFYSGGRWETDNYGVDYCVADHPMGPWDDSGSEAGPRVLKSVPDKVLGPGHNSIVRGPDNETDYIVYHAWDPLRTARRMCIDRLLWTPDGPRADGPTTTPQAVTHVLSRQDVL
jgi:GH43 family beta-xylosidase